jgi:hypothetical protein
MVAKLADFGISKVAPEFDEHLATRPAGTVGYCFPPMAWIPIPVMIFQPILPVWWKQSDVLAVLYLPNQLLPTMFSKIFFFV